MFSDRRNRHQHDKRSGWNMFEHHHKPDFAGHSLRLFEPCDDTRMTCVRWPIEVCGVCHLLVSSQAQILVPQGFGEVQENFWRWNMIMEAEELVFLDMWHCCQDQQLGVALHLPHQLPHHLPRPWRIVGSFPPLLLLHWRANRLFPRE